MRIWKHLKKSKIIHDAFEAGVTIKLIDGILEIVGGIILIFISPASFNRWVVYFTQSELIEDPKDVVANFLLHLAHNFTVGTQIFGVIYLLVHGIIKVFLVVKLWEKKLWAYPTAMFFFSLFIVYQTYEYFLNQSVFMLVLTILDIFVVFLTWVEYKRVKDAAGTA